MTYTIQADLDSTGLAARWACTFCGFINAAEYTRQRIATQSELDRVIGRAFRERYAAMANYKNDATVSPPVPDLKGWDSVANPEWHYLVEKRRQLFAITALIMDTDMDPDRFRVAIMKTQYGTNHYCVLADDQELINPDPNLFGDIIRTTEFLY